VKYVFCTPLIKNVNFFPCNNLKPFFLVMVTVFSMMYTIKYFIKF